MNSYDIVSLIVLVGLATLAIFCYAFRKKDLAWIMRPDDFINTKMIIVGGMYILSKFSKKANNA